METPASCEVDRLPEELLLNVISLLTSPIDACRAAAVSLAFRAAADSDAVWSGFLPRKLPQFAKGELPRRKPMSKKDLFRRLSDQPVLFPHKIIGMQLERATGAQRLTLSLSALQIPPGRYWHRFRVDSVSKYSKRDPRLVFTEAAQFFPVNRLEFGAKIQRNILSQNTTYRVYMVFEPPAPCYLSHRHEFPTMEASIGLAGKQSIRRVCLRDNVKGENLRFPRKRADGWMEVELGEFRNMEGNCSGDELLISLAETTPKCTYGLVVWVLELRSTPSVRD